MPSPILKTPAANVNQNDSLLPSKRLIKKSCSQVTVRRDKDKSLLRFQKLLSPLDMVSAKEQRLPIEIQSRPLSAIPSFKTGSESKSELRDSLHLGG